MWFERLIEKRLEKLEIQYFLHDPEGDPDRAGDGYYYREPGDKGWSGSWYDEDECLEVARESFEEEYEEIEAKRVVFDNDTYEGFFRYLAQGKSRIEKLSYDPFAIYWSKRVKGGKYAFSLMIIAKGDESAKESVVGRLGATTTFKVERLDGSLAQVCSERGLIHPVAAAEQKVFAEPTLPPGRRR